MKTILFLIHLLFSYSLQAETWSINPDHSEVFFKINYLKYAEVTGRIKKFDGEVIFDLEREPSKLKVKIQLESLDTGNSVRDGHLKSFDFFNSKTFPEANFESLEIKKIKPQDYEAIGYLIIKNIKKRITMRFSITEVITDTWNFKHRYSKFKSQIHRHDFNLKWNKTLMNNHLILSDEVEIYGQIQLQPEGKKTPGSHHKIPDTQYIREREKLNRGEKNLSSEFKITNSSKSIVSQKIYNQEKKQKNYDKTEPEKSFIWWLALFFMGLIGFIASIIVAYIGKKFLADHFGTKYTENGLSGLITDVMAILVLITYSVCFWIIGWT